MTYKDALHYTMEQLKPMNLMMPGLEAREIVAYASASCGMQVNRDDIVRLGALDAPHEMKEALDDMLERRLRGEPLAYLIGEWDFYGITLEINQDVLIPRQDTETLVDWAIPQMKNVKSPRILDLCCGSGAIGIALLSHLPEATCVFADHSRGALRVTRKNLANCGFEGRSEVVELDALEPASPALGQFDLIVCNPPYITAEEMLSLPIDVTGFEPQDALYGGHDGLSFYRAISVGYKNALKPGAAVIFECGAYQAFEVQEILERAGYREVERHMDLNEFERAVSARV
ncbi:MAG: peptide chain release factor N(5)-glutamine methyltransferase [Ruminococcaceae bacterium]|nr:peptide chain release factor N(5)-glutamine methyltransferase [Oscillospiraceae bacterium]